MRTWRLLYWTRILAVLFVTFMAATAVFDVSLAPSSNTVEVETPSRSGSPSEVPDVEDVFHEGAADEVGGWLSSAVDGGLQKLESLRVEIRDLGSSVGDAVGL